eukprot:CAMPEP_0172199134 /NCGR_PEP_ID=MMETSP1050-20130122/28501_1 /TAXON_ID=233186 /ORGANISM="Cryptomonas curvata, Strain CCAP979/52" /LENGTH=156 /DNA_ID=CAMNT_0012876087 /DNA_START=138 /DNA_END=608 /DNA_ORIENTATION=-
MLQWEFPQIDLLLKKIRPNESNIIILVDWDYDALSAFVAALKVDVKISLPEWITTTIEAMTVSSLTNDIISVATQFGGTAFGRLVLVMHSLQEYHAVTTMLRRVESGTELQPCMQKMSEGIFLASLYILSGSSLIVAEVIPYENLALDEGKRSMFK